MGTKSGDERSQKFMPPSLCPVMYRFFTFEKPLKRAAFKLLPSFGFVSKERRDGMVLARRMVILNKIIEIIISHHWIQYTNNELIERRIYLVSTLPRL